MRWFPRGLLVLVFAIVACSEKQKVASGSSDAPVVPAARAMRTTLTNSVTLTAEFQPFFEVNVMAKEAGYVRRMYVDIGDHVKQGQLLAALEIPELEDDLTKAKADVRAAQAEKAAADGDLKRAQAAQSIAHLSYTRILDVSKKEPGLVPLQEVDVARSRDLEAEGQIAAAQEKVQAAIGRYQAASAELAHENSLYAYTKIVAPFDGVVTQRYASDGSMIQAGTSSQTQAMPVVRVSENDILRLMLPVPEADAGTIRDGQKVSVRVPSLNKTFLGTITRYADRVQMSTRTMTTEIDVKNSKRDLIPGMYAEVNLNLVSANDAVAVPIEAVDTNGNDHRVFVVDKTGIIHIRQVKTGIQSPQYVQVLSGLQAGETVIVGRHSDYRDGEKVEPNLLEANASETAHS